MGTSLVKREQEALRGTLLESYFHRASVNLKAFVDAALRLRSTAMRDVLVVGAVYGETSSAKLKERVLGDNWDPQRVVKDPRILAELGRLAILQNVFKDDLLFGRQLIESASRVNPDTRLPRYIRRTLVQAYISAGYPNKAEKILDGSPDLRSEGFSYLPAELENPFIFQGDRSFEIWLDNFNRAFEHHHIAQVRLCQEKSTVPFDRLTSAVKLSPVGDDIDSPLVSVILTAYRPDESRISSSVRSVLNQTWRNLELIIIDDHSGAEFAPIFKRLASLDSRVSVITAPENKGTYVARNTGFRAAKGEFITGQDDDDWSHPQRLEYQVAYMQKHQNAAGCRVRAIRCDENLGRVRLGEGMLGQNASSLFIRRADLIAVGGFMRVRKAADTEFHYRLVAATGRPIADLREPLSIIRVLEASLSSGDFGPGWRHSSRRAFRSSYEYWHRTSRPEDLKLEEEVMPRVKIPRRFNVRQTSQKLHLDVVFVGDWERLSSSQRVMLERVKALSVGGLRVGILNSDTDWFTERSPQNSLADEVQELINGDSVDEVHYDEDVSVGLMVLQDPVILQFPPQKRSALRVQKMMIFADTAPITAKSGYLRYLPSECLQNAEDYFRVVPIWVPLEPEIRSSLQEHLEPNHIADNNEPGIIDVKQRGHSRLWFRSTFPVVGYYLAGSTEDVTTAVQYAVASLITDNEIVDLRIMGHFGEQALKDIRRIVKNSFGVYDLSAARFGDIVKNIDYFIYLEPDNRITKADPVILEAIASGAIAILPPTYQPTYGDAAIYCELDKVRERISDLHADFRIFSETQNYCREALEDRFSYEAYQSRVMHILSPSYSFERS